MYGGNVHGTSICNLYISCRQHESVRQYIYHCQREGNHGDYFVVPDDLKCSQLLEDSHRDDPNIWVTKCVASFELRHDYNWHGTRKGELIGGYN